LACIRASKRPRAYFSSSNLCGEFNRNIYDEIMIRCTLCWRWCLCESNKFYFVIKHSHICEIAVAVI
jgi:hypothetical protein